MVGFDCFPAYFLSPTALYLSPVCRPVAPCRLIRAHPIPSYSFHPLGLLRSPRSHRHHSPPVVSSKRGGFSKRIEFDAFEIVAMERRLPTACLPSDGFHAARRLISSSHRIRHSLAAYRRPIPSRCRSADEVAVPIAPRFPPRPACRRTGRRCLDVIGCHAVDTVICDSRGAFALSSLPAVISSSHPLSLIAHPSLPGSLVPVCFKQSPAPGRGRRRREDVL